MAETVDNIILGALRQLKVKESGENLSAAAAADGLIALNDLIELCNLQPLMQLAKVKLTQTLTASDATYTFGASGDNSTRPLEIHSAYIRSGNVDYPVRVLGNEEYSLIAFKTITSTYPYNLYYRAAYPQGVVNLYPVPSTANVLHLEVRAALSTYSAGSDSVDLAPAYIKYFKSQLAIDISPEYKDPSPVVYESAREAKAWIKRTNAIDKPVMANTAQIATGRGGNASRLFGVS